MKVDYYIVNRKIKEEITRLRKFCEKMADKDYISIMRYCRKNNGTVVNGRFGEKFGSEMSDALRQARGNAERLYRIKIATGTERGFYMADLSKLGIYSFSNLCNFLNKNKQYYIENNHDETITLATLKQIALVKGVHLFSKKEINDRNRIKLEKATTLINEVLADLQVDKQEYDKILEDSFDVYSHLLLCNIANGLEEVMR